MYLTYFLPHSEQQGKFYQLESPLSCNKLYIIFFWNYKLNLVCIYIYIFFFLVLLFESETDWSDSGNGDKKGMRPCSNLNLANVKP